MGTPLGSKHKEELSGGRVSAETWKKQPWEYMENDIVAACAKGLMHKVC